MSPSSTIKTLFLTSLLYSTTSAFVPLTHLHPPIDNNINHMPAASEPDTLSWVPIATLAPITRTSTSIPTATPTPSSQPLADDDTEYNILPFLDPFMVPDLKKRSKRQVTGQSAAAAAPTAIGQIGPVTTYLANSQIAPGSVVQVPVVYTQTFVSIPDQWPGAAAGTIGMGTITGQIGVVRTKAKRDEEMTKTVSWNA